MAEAWQPPVIYNFPPFFTLQPADVTRAKQLEQWKQLVVGWHQAHKQQVMSVKEWPFWENRAIARALPEEGVAQVMNHIVTTGSGEWADATRTRCRIFYRTPSEWAAKLHALAEGNAMTATLYTLYELHSGGALYGTDFAGMDPQVLLKALEVLQSQGLAELYRQPGGSIDEIGVKLKPR